MRLAELRAKTILSWNFLLQLFLNWSRKLFFFWKPRDGLKLFFEYYGPDGIGPVSEGERSLFPKFQKCQACSQCTFSCSAIIEGRAPASFEPKFIMLGLGRSAHESEVFLEEWLPCLECNECVVQCPNDVPVHAMAQQIIDRRNRVGFRIPPPTGASQ